MENIIRLSFILCLLVRQFSGQTNCVIDQAAMTCHYEIPNIIPDNVQEVFIRDLNGSFGSHKFADESWKSVTLLDISSNILSLQLSSGTFSPLISLKRLGIHQSKLLEMEKHVFTGLDNVELLDLSGCRKLYMIHNTLNPSFFDALSAKGVLPKINTLNLINVGNYANRPLLFDADFIRMINDRGIKSLMLGKQTILVDFDIYEVWPSPPYVPFPVQSLYASSVVMTVLQSTNKGRLIDSPVFEVLTNLKKITLSDIPVNSVSVSSVEQRNSRSLCMNESRWSTTLLTFILFVKEFNLQNVIFSTGYMFDIVDSSSCTLMRLKRLKVNSCGIKKINITWTIPDNAYLDEIDLSNNDIYYFFVNGNMQSKRLILNNNNLQKMYSFPKFSQVFVTWTMLEYLDLGLNGLLNLPRGIFSRNMQLKKLFLNDNELTMVPKTLTDLKSLQLLDLRNNLIKSLDANVIVDLQKLIQIYNTTVDLKMNPFECSCKTRDFVKWISSITYHRREYNCYMEGKSVKIGVTTFRDCKFLCYRDSLYVGITIVCLIVVIVVILVTTKRYSMLQKRAYDNERQAFITTYLEGNIVCNTRQHFENMNDILEVQRQEFLVMLAHHNDDKSMCNNKIYDPFHKGLKSLIRTTNDLVFFDKEPPGVSIFTEMERGTLISCVFICFVTEDVCNDDMFECYLNNAISLKKPIVLMLWGSVVDVLPPMIKALLRTAYTISMDNEDQTPDWDTICKHILNLAVKANRKSESNFSVKTFLWQTLCSCPKSTFMAIEEEDLPLNEYTHRNLDRMMD